MVLLFSGSSNDKWTFTTIYEPHYGEHPVSGNRDFGYTYNADGSYTFYTRGVDRLTDISGSKLEKYTRDQSGNGYPFRQADSLWVSLQDKISSFVNQNQGSAEVIMPAIKRPDWQKVKDVLDGTAPLSSLSKDCK